MERIERDRRNKKNKQSTDYIFFGIFWLIACFSTENTATKEGKFHLTSYSNNFSNMYYPQRTEKKHLSWWTLWM